jgi:hypothetical protein
MKALLLTCFFTVLGSALFGQNTTEIKENEKPTKIQSTKSPEKEIRKGPYLGRDKKIMSLMKDGKIPASFPRYEDGTSKEDYKLLIASWFKSNKNLVKEQEYKKLEPKL